jgi:hypothetical protein
LSETEGDLAWWLAARKMRAAWSLLCCMQPWCEQTCDRSQRGKQTEFAQKFQRMMRIVDPSHPGKMKAVKKRFGSKVLYSNR